MASDAELLDAWRGGDARAGSRLFDRHYARLARFFANKVAARDEVYDLVQQSLLACVEHRGALLDDERFAAFVLGIARNVLLHHYRTRARKRDPIDFGVSSVADLFVAATSIVAQRRRDRVLLEALRRLAIEDQILLELYYWEELSGPLLAELYGVPEGTIRTRLRTARRALERQLPRAAAALREGEGEDGPLDLDAWARETRALLDDAGRG